MEIISLAINFVLGNYVILGTYKGIEKLGWSLIGAK